MRNGQFSAYINTGTGSVALVKGLNSFEYQDNLAYTVLCEELPRQRVLTLVEDYFEENYIPDEKRIILWP